VRFVITYDGADLEAGRMDARQLGEVMIEIAGVIDASAGVTFGSGIRIDTEIDAEFKGGSFSIYVIAAAIPDAVNQLVQSMTMKDLLELIGLTGGGGLIGLLKFLRKREPKSIEATGDGQMVITTEDGDVTQVRAGTVVLLQNSNVRLHLDGVVSPLKGDGVNEFRSGMEDGPKAVVLSPEAEYFDPPDAEGEQLQDRVSEEIVQLVGLQFLEGRKWRFRMPDGTMFTSGIDDDFTERVLTHDIEFGAGDALVVMLRTIVVRDTYGVLRANREIVRVLDRIPAPKIQLALQLDDKRRREQQRLPPGQTGGGGAA
jgi:hypothetical protein